MSSLLWWVGQIVSTLLGAFFLLFGIHLLIQAYALNDPFLFIMTFFASSFVILISAALLAGFVVKMIAAIRSPREDID